MKKHLVLSAFFMLLQLFLFAQTRGLFIPTTNGQTQLATNEKRIALVIGNKDYGGGGWQPLKNPVNDANLMASALRNVGFEVITITNASRERIQSGINELTKKVSGKETVALVFYAGHGVTADNKNWIVPTDDRSACQEDITTNCISLDFINTKLKNAGTAFNVIVSDACRNNTLPFTCPTSNRDGSKVGFIEYKPRGSCIAFSTAPNTTASDGRGNNSPFTDAFARTIGIEGLTIESVFKQVIRELADVGQEPWMNNSFSGDFYFKKTGGATPIPATPVVTPTPATPKNADFIETATGTSFAMKYIEGKSFQMGSNDADAGSNEKPVHTVSIGNFYMAKYEVTFNEYDAFCEATRREKPSDGGWGRGTRPVINVSWEDAVAYCKWLSSTTGKTYRLPTEAEWEYAARGGESHKYAGNSNIDEVAWYDGNSGNKTHEVGGKSANSLGLYDMTGNIWEWCSDLYGAYSSESQQNPIGAVTGSSRVTRVTRGGSWYDGALHCRVSLRNNYTPTGRYNDLGFRVACLSQ